MSQIKERKSIFGKIFGGKSKSQPKTEKPSKRSHISGLSPVSSSTELATPPPPPKAAQPPFTFSGKDAEECQIFIRNIWQFAHQRAKESDERWKAGLAGFCMVGVAKEWYENELDARTRNDWDLLKVALIERFPTTRDLSEAIPTVPDTPPPILEKQLFTWLCDFSQRDVKPSSNPTIPTPAAVITAEPSLSPSAHLTFAAPPSAQKSDSPLSPPRHSPPSSPSRSITFMKPVDVNKTMEGYIRVVTWDEQPVYIGRTLFHRGCYATTANLMTASPVIFDPSEDRYGLKLRHPIGHRQWLAIAWSSYSDSALDAACLVASTAPTSSSCWLSCSLPDVEGPIRPFVWSIYPDGSIAVNYYDPAGVRRRLTAVVIENAGSTKDGPNILMVHDYDKFVTQHKQANPGAFVYQPARLVFQPR